MGFWGFGEMCIRDSDDSVGVPFANAIPEDLKWKGMKDVIETTTQAQNEKERLEEIRATSACLLYTSPQNPKTPKPQNPNKLNLFPIILLITNTRVSLLA